MSTPDNKGSKTKLLTLQRESLVTLNPETLDEVVGGLIFITRGNSCCIANSCNTKTKA